MTERLRIVLLRAIQVLVAGPGLLLAISALAANQDWLDRHFLPLFFFPREKVVAQETLIRIICGLTGLVLVIFVRPAIGRMTRRMSTREIAAACARIVLAVGLAFCGREPLLARQ